MQTLNFGVDVMQSHFSLILNHAYNFCNTFHSSNVVSVHLPVSVSELTLLIMDFTILGQIATCAIRLTIVCLPRVEPSTEEWYEMHVETKQ